MRKGVKQINITNDSISDNFYEFSYNGCSYVRNKNTNQIYNYTNNQICELYGLYDEQNNKIIKLKKQSCDICI